MKKSKGLIIISPALAEGGTVSHLYGDFQDAPSRRKGSAILTLTAPAVRLGCELLANLPNSTFYLPKRLTDPGDAQQERVRVFQESFRQALQSAFIEHESLVCIMASGIVVREIAPLLKNKHSHPAVVVLGAEGRFAVSLLSRHEGGANALALQIAAITGGQEMFAGGLVQKKDLTHVNPMESKPSCEHQSTAHLIRSS